MNPYDKAAKMIIDLCCSLVRGEELKHDDSVVNLFGFHLAQYIRLKEDVIDILCDFEVEVRKPIPL